MSRGWQGPHASTGNEAPRRRRQPPRNVTCRRHRAYGANEPRGGLRCLAMDSALVVSSHGWQSPHISDEASQQWGGIVASPSKCLGLKNLQVDHRGYDNTFRAPPARGAEDPSHAQPSRNETEDCCLIESLLNDVGRLQTSTKASEHQSVVERRALAPWKPGWPISQSPDPPPNAATAEGTAGDLRQIPCPLLSPEAP
jgi:hypothetical protein